MKQNGLFNDIVKKGLIEENLRTILESWRSTQEAEGVALEMRQVVKAAREFKSPLLLKSSLYINIYRGFVPLILMRFIRFKKVLEAEKEMTKVKLNLNQTHCCGIYSDKTVYSFTGDSYQELFYLLQRRGLIESFIDGDFIVYDELRQYSDLPPYQKLTEEELEAIDFDSIIQNLSDNEIKSVIETFFAYRFECEFQEVEE